MSKNHLALLAVVAGIAALAGCDQARPLEGTQGGQGGACGTCHGYPPPPGAGLPTSNPSAHPANVTNCYACHSTTVDASGNLVPATSGGTHQNGTIDVTNPHATTPNWADPSVHAPAAVADIASCQACHGADFNGGGYAPMNCNACHQNAGWNASALTTNCTFCHGTETPAGYPRIANPILAGPPRVPPGITDPVGVHQAHLTGTRYRQVAVVCADCHTVPPSGDVTHLSDATRQWAFNTWSALATGNGAVAASFDGAALTCTNYCHGAPGSGLSGGLQTTPSWTGTISGCTPCHGDPPPLKPDGSAHSSSTACGNCHSGYTSSSVNKATHINGTVESTSQHPSNFADPAQHGPAAIADISSCQGCHGTTFDGDVGPSCNACHSAAPPTGGGWNTSALTTNCTFCHGTKTKAGYAWNANPVAVAPPEAVNGNPSNPAIGAHQAHLAGPYTYSDGLACNDCHSVPAQGDLAHIAGAAGVDFTWSDLAKGVGAVGGPVTPTWSATNLTCTNYCHGATLLGGTATSPSWTATSVACNACHGLGPNTGQHQKHVSYYSSRVPPQSTCYKCHASVATDTVTPAISATGRALHVDGHNDIVFGTRPTATYDPAGSGTCTNICHGTDVWR